MAPKQLILVCLVALLPVSFGGLFSEQQYQTLFSQWTAQYSKHYACETEQQHRFNIFKQNFDYIVTRNSRPAVTYQLAMNQFGDMTFDEIAKLKTPPRSMSKASPVTLSEPQSGVPKFLNWTALGMVTPVQEEGMCGSCYAFSVTHPIESAVAIAGGKLTLLSAQQILDCSDSAGNGGCSGGLIDSTYQWIEQQGGLCADADYPYTASSNGTCNTTCKPVATIKGFQDVVANNETQLMYAVARQPVSVAVDAFSTVGDWYFYSSGIFSNCTSSGQVDHTATVVGYGTSSQGVDFWIIKNSWGTSWGMQGYILLARNVESPSGECGVASMPSFPIV